MKTIKDIIAELEKFKDRSAPLTIIASTNREDPESGENFIDGAVVQRVSVNALDGRMDIKVSDEGTWTVSDALTVLRKAGKPESVARVKIGYGAHPMTDSEGSLSPSAWSRTARCSRKTSSGTSRSARSSRPRAKADTASR